MYYASYDADSQPASILSPMRSLLYTEERKRVERRHVMRGDLGHIKPQRSTWTCTSGSKHFTHRATQRWRVHTQQDTHTRSSQSITCACTLEDQTSKKSMKQHPSMNARFPSANSSTFLKNDVWTDQGYKENRIMSRGHGACLYTLPSQNFQER